MKQHQQSPGSRLKDAFAGRNRHDCARIDEQLSARRPRKILLSLRVLPDIERVGARRYSEHATSFFIALPREQCGILGHQLLQTLDVVVVDDAFSLHHRPFQTSAETLAHFGGEVLPTGVTVLTGEYELGVAERDGTI